MALLVSVVYFLRMVSEAQVRVVPQDINYRILALLLGFPLSIVAVSILLNTSDHFHESDAL